MKSIPMAMMLAVFMAGLCTSCATAPPPPAASQSDSHIVQGGAFAGEGKIYFPLPFQGDKK
jgi:hypothetical protein